VGTSQIRHLGIVDEESEPVSLIAAAAGGDVRAFEQLYARFAPRVYGLCLRLGGTPAADFDVQSVSGNISNCFGPKPKEAQYGPGSRLAFKSGEGNAHVQIETKSGNVSLCTKDSQGKKDSQAKRSADATTASGCERSPMFYKVDETEHGDRPRRFPLI
jgi:hypothetical protein